MQRGLQIQEKLDFFQNALHLQVGCHIGGSLAMQGCKEEQLCVCRKNADACQGDSGGPLTVEMNNKHYLVGIVRGGKGCATVCVV